MARIDRQIAIAALLRILSPVVRFALRHSLKIQDIVEALKIAFLQEAQRELLREGRTCNASRLSMMTGVHRKDVARFESSDHDLSSQPEKAIGPKDLVTKVIGLWQTDRNFTTSLKAPRILSAGGLDSEFAKLVAKVSVDVNPAAVLAEMERIEAITRTKNGIKLIQGAYTPKNDVAAGFSLLGSDLDDLIQAVEGNILHEEEIKNLHVRTEYDNVRPESARLIKQWFLKEGHRLHLLAREMISCHDQDVNPDPKHKGGKGLRVVLGSFGFIEKKEK